RPAGSAAGTTTSDTSRRLACELVVSRSSRSLHLIFRHVRAFGPGLQGGVVGKPAPFTIDTKGAGAGGLGLTVEGPCEAKIECQDNGDGTCSVAYLPTEAGEYAINILFAERHVPGSPFKAAVRPAFDPSKVTASGPGLERAKAGETATFTVDCTRAGDAELTIEIVSETGAKAEVRIQKTAEGTFSVTYVPPFHGAHTITIKYGGHAIPHFPKVLQVDPSVDTSGVHVYGPGVEPRGERNARRFECRGTLTRGLSPAWDIGCQRLGRGLKEEWREGFHGEPQITLRSALFPGVLREVTTHFIVDARALNKVGGNHVKARIVSPSGTATDGYTTDKGDGTYRVEYTPFEDGTHLIEVLYDDVPVPKSPFRVSVAEGCDPTRVRAYGPGLEGGITNKPNCFTVETRGAGTGGLGLTIEGASEAKISCKDNKDGSCSVEYVPFTPGDYDVNINYGGHPIPGSPFKVPVKDPVDASKVKCSGPGLGSGVRAHIPQTFTADCTRAGQAALDVKLFGPTGNRWDACYDDLGDNRDGTYTVSYVPDSIGPYTITIKYGGDEIPYSPYRIQSNPTGDASKCRLTGNGGTDNRRYSAAGVFVEALTVKESQPSSAL
uniref:Filamin C, gamma b (actin binding protein 280) n=1 Tax=Hippocampus comes TaxID=109280 RepID=A0A3Q2XW38_HIPCM